MSDFVMKYGNNTIYVARDLSCVVTHLACGGNAPARPNGDSESVARCVALGYAPSIAECTEKHLRLMMIEHELIHTLLAVHTGKSYSLALAHVAGKQYMHEHHRKVEENIVYALQSVANGKPDCEWNAVLQLFYPGAQTLILDELLSNRGLWESVAINA